MGRTDRHAARQVVLETLAADAACDPSALAGDGITVVTWREMPGRRRFDLPPKPFQIVTMGHGLVVSCHPDWLAWTRARAAAMDRAAFLDPAGIAAIVALLEPAGHALIGPHTSYGCSADTLREAPVPREVTLAVVDGPGLEALRPGGVFPNALGSRPNFQRPDVVAVTASASGEIVGCAAASADSDRLWQVGVDVVAPWRGRGVGRAVVGRLTAAVLDAGMVPYYTHGVSNVPSAALATSVGYWPAWVQWYAREPR